MNYLNINIYIQPNKHEDEDKKIIDDSFINYIEHQRLMFELKQQIKSNSENMNQQMVANKEV